MGARLDSLEYLDLRSESEWKLVIIPGFTARTKASVCALDTSNILIVGGQGVETNHVFYATVLDVRRKTLKDVKNGGNLVPVYSS